MSLEVLARAAAATGDHDRYCGLKDVPFNSVRSGDALTRPADAGATQTRSDVCFLLPIERGRTSDQRKAEPPEN
jgi:hypothetical protein